MLKILYYNILIFEICTGEICEMFVYKHSETIKYVKISLLVRNLQTLRVDNLIILRIKNSKLSMYCFYMNTNT